MFMKRQFSFLWVAFAIPVALEGCGPYIPTDAASGSALVKVECRDASVRQILDLLRSGKGKDISVRDEGSCREITAAFSPADTAPRKLGQILQDLNDMSGVLNVDIVENPHPIRKNF
jgi:hypothetical protein